ncbi:hypothetical protein TELCIR_23894 [Teladorsagia circumcincta]|uniref:Uncharacterized protein n=1 Tax=Teladorsagia circumcincta TaxID=45464 RepID=A0A2G9T9T3_TELCI|nr:hypothetical protein TELCIR_23894 [Teladorsagia circumcincta]
MHEAAKLFMKKWSGMIAFDVGSADKAITVVESVRLIIHAVSLGGTESLMEHPLSMSHSSQLLRDMDEPMVPPVSESKTPTTSSPIWKGPSVGSDQHPSDFVCGRNKNSAQLS